MKELRDLPNVEGFVFTACYKDGSEKQQKVTKDLNGLHTTDNFTDLKGWR